MTNIILDSISLILLLPLWIFLIIMCGRFFSVYVNKNVIYFLTLFSSFLGAGVCGSALIKMNEPLEWIHPFIKINDFKIFFGLQIDKISLIIALLLFIISFAIQMFSISYMKEEKKNYRFFALLNLFNFSMGGLLFSPNLFQFYVFWELVSIVSYLLIGFDYKNNEKSSASKRVFLMNRFGDTALITGILIIAYYMYTFSGNLSFATLYFEDFNVISTLLLAYAPANIFFAVCGLFIIAASVKSAQFPFYTWLQDAMEAKTPVSALLHSATMVIAGVYLLIRMLPFFTLAPLLLKAVLLIGLLTAFICSILASIECHPKKVLAYSTSANIGLMFSAIGLVSVKTCLVLLIVHAFIKSLLFILLPKENLISKINLGLFIITSLSLAGIIFSGVAPKELLFEYLKHNRILSYLFLFVCFMTGFYIIRLSILIYRKYKLINNVNISELISYIILLSGNICIYLIIKNHTHIAEPAVISVGGLCLALLLNNHNALEKVNTTPKILEKFYNNFISFVYTKISDLCNFIEKNIFTNYKLLLLISKAPVKITNWIEQNIMNKSVSFVSESAKKLSQKDMVLQSGNVQTYNAYALIIITIITVFTIIVYTAIFWQ